MSGKIIFISVLNALIAAFRLRTFSFRSPLRKFSGLFLFSQLFRPDTNTTFYKIPILPCTKPACQKGPAFLLNSRSASARLLHKKASSLRYFPQFLCTGAHIRPVQTDTERFICKHFTDTLPCLQLCQFSCQIMPARHRVIVDIVMVKSALSMQANFFCLSDTFCKKQRILTNFQVSIKRNVL